MNSNHPILLMTACINPNGMSNTACQNKNIREVQYLEALNFYLSNTKFNILFVENSGIDISGRYHEVIKKGRLEVITFDGNHYDRKLGKGFGEGLIIKQAFEKSDLLKTSKVVIKVSGRHIVKNINLIWKSIQFIKTGVGEFCSCDLNPRSKSALSDIFVSSIDFYNNVLLKLLSLIDESQGIWFEHVLYKSVQKYVELGGEILLSTNLSKSNCSKW